VSGFRPVTANEAEVGTSEAITGVEDETAAGNAKAACDMQQVMQQWWCDARGPPSSPPHSPASHPAQPTHASPPASSSAANTAVDARRTTIRADSARIAVVRLPELKRLDLTRTTIGSKDQRVKRALKPTTEPIPRPTCPRPDRPLDSLLKWSIRLRRHATGL